MGGNRSHGTFVARGVPQQGSILGLLPFVIYILTTYLIFYNVHQFYTRMIQLLSVMVKTWLRLE